MHSVHFSAQTSANGVVELDFTVGEVPGVLWSSASGSDRSPLVLLGHGGGTHKRAAGMVGRAHRLVNGGGFAVATVDAPGHGGRPRTAIDEQEISALQQAMAAGEPVGPIVERYNADIARRAVPEWQATLDALQELPEIGREGPIGYYGLNMGTAIGVPLAAAEPRIAAAVFGIFWPGSLVEAGGRSPYRSSSCSNGTTNAFHVNPASRCSTHSPRRRRCCTPTRVGTSTCQGSRRTVPSGSSPGTSARPVDPLERGSARYSGTRCTWKRCSATAGGLRRRSAPSSAPSWSPGARPR
jgi:hypothetical protein